MLKKTLLLSGLIALSFTSQSFAGNLVVTATNNADYSVAIGGGSADEGGRRGGSAESDAGTAIAGSIVMPSYFDCDCLRSLTLNNTSSHALAAGDAIAGSIVLQGRTRSRR